MHISELRKVMTKREIEESKRIALEMKESIDKGKKNA